MKGLHQQIERMRLGLRSEATVKKLLFSEEYFKMILTGCSEHDLEELIRKNLKGDCQTWHLAQLLPKLAEIQTLSHRIFREFQRQLPKELPAMSLRELEYAMLQKIEDYDYRPILRRAGLDRGEVREVDAMIQQWSELEHPDEPPAVAPPQEVFVLLKSRNEHVSDLRLFTPQHPNLVSSRGWKLLSYYFLRFELPADTQSFEFRLANTKSHQTFINLGRESFFTLESIYENASVSKLDPMTLSEELCVIGLMLSDWQMLLKFLRFLEKEPNQRSKASSQLKFLKEAKDTKCIEDAFAASEPPNRLRLSYLLTAIIEAVDREIPLEFPNNLISKLLVACEIATQVPNNPRMVDLDNSFRTAKMLADYSNNAGKLSSSLFDSLLLGAGQKNLIKLTEVLEMDNKTHRRLQILREKLRVAVYESQHGGYRFLLMLAVVFVGRCHFIECIKVVELLELVIELNKRQFVESDNDIDLKKRIATQFTLIDGLEVDWERQCATTKLKVLAELLSQSHPACFELLFNSKIKKEMTSGLSVLMRQRHPESVKLLAVLFVGSGNTLLKLADFESPFRDLMAVKREGPSLLNIPGKEFLKPFFSQVLLPLLLGYPVVGELLRTICQTFAEAIVANKLTFDQLLNCLNNQFKFQPNDSQKLLTEGLNMLLDCISKMGNQSAYDWKLLLTKGEWIDIFKCNEFLQLIIVVDLSNRLKIERAHTNGGGSAALERCLQTTLLETRLVPFTPEVKSSLVLRLFHLKNPTNEHLRQALLNTPSRIRAYWLLATVTDERQRTDILARTASIKSQIDVCQLSRKQIRNLMEHTSGELWKIIADLFDRQSPTPTQTVVANIEIKCQIFCLNLKKCIGFCRGYEQSVPSLKHALKEYEERLAAFGEDSSATLNFVLPDVLKRLYKCVNTSEVPLELLIKLRVRLIQQMTLVELCDAIDREIELYVRDNERREIAMTRRAP